MLKDNILGKVIFQTTNETFQFFLFHFFVHSLLTNEGTVLDE